jgi:hypothetical protein
VTPSDAIAARGHSQQSGSSRSVGDGVVRSALALVADRRPLASRRGGHVTIASALPAVARSLAALHIRARLRAPLEALLHVHLPLLIALRALEEAGTEEAQRHRAPDEERRLTAREIFDARGHIVQRRVLEVMRDLLDLVRGLLGVFADAGLLLIAKLPSVSVALVFPVEKRDSTCPLAVSRAWLANC